MELHPATVHFPIALLVTAGICWILVLAQKPAFKSVGFWLHTFGLIGVIGAIITGNLETPLNLSQEAENLLENHETLGYVIGWLFLMLWIWAYLRLGDMGPKEMLAFTLTFWGFLVFVGWTAWIGGKLVYEWGVGVST